MNQYHSPEMIFLGEAICLIRGSKAGKGESFDPVHEIAPNECTED